MKILALSFYGLLASGFFLFQLLSSPLKAEQQALLEGETVGEILALKSLPQGGFGLHIQIEGKNQSGWINFPQGSTSPPLSLSWLDSQKESVPSPSLSFLKKRKGPSRAPAIIGPPTGVQEIDSPSRNPAIVGTPSGIESITSPSQESQRSVKYIRLHKQASITWDLRPANSLSYWDGLLAGNYRFHTRQQPQETFLPLEKVALKSEKETGQTLWIPQNFERGLQVLVDLPHFLHTFALGERRIPHCFPTAQTQEWVEGCEILEEIYLGMNHLQNISKEVIRELQICLKNLLDKRGNVHEEDFKNKILEAGKKGIHEKKAIEMYIENQKIKER